MKEGKCDGDPPLLSCDWGGGGLIVTQVFDLIFQRICSSQHDLRPTTMQHFIACTVRVHWGLRTSIFAMQFTYFQEKTKKKLYITITLAIWVSLSRQCLGASGVRSFATTSRQLHSLRNNTGYRTCHALIWPAVTVFTPLWISVSWVRPHYVQLTLINSLKNCFSTIFLRVWSARTVVA